MAESGSHWYFRHREVGEEDLLEFPKKKGSPERARTVHQGGHVASGQGSEKTPKGYES
jgi:hypothetical protein